LALADGSVFVIQFTAVVGLAVDSNNNLVVVFFEASPSACADYFAEAVEGASRKMLNTFTPITFASDPVLNERARRARIVFLTPLNATVPVSPRAGSETLRQSKVRMTEHVT
jgi:hypothetical protein